MQLKKRQLAYAAIAALILVVVVVAMLPDAVRVQTAKVERGGMMVTTESRGETRVRERFVLTAPISGRVTRIDLREGAAIAPRQLITTIAAVPIDPRQREETESHADAAEASQREAAAAVRSAEAAYELARRERERVERLSREGVATTQLVDQARTAEERGKRELDAARERVGAAASNVAAVRATLRPTGTRGSVEVRSPVAGRLLRVPERSERIVRAGEPLVEIGDARQLELVIEVLSEEAVRIRPGHRVIVEQWGGDKPLHGTVRLVEPAAFKKISALGIEEQRVNVIADLATAPAELGDAYRIEAKIIVWEGDAVLKIPVSALARAGDGWTVFAVENGRAKRYPVEIGHRNPLEAEVLKGVTEGVEVIVHPGHDVEDGARVKVADE